MRNTSKTVKSYFVEIGIGLSMLALIGVLAYPVFNSIQTRIKISDMSDSIDTIKSAVSDYREAHQRYPRNIREAGLSQFKSEFIENITVDSSGIITIQTNQKTLGVFLKLSYQAIHYGYAIRWKCSAKGETNYLALACR